MIKQFTTVCSLGSPSNKVFYCVSAEIYNISVNTVSAAAEVHAGFFCSVSHKICIIDVIGVRRGQMAELGTSVC